MQRYEKRTWSKFTYKHVLFEVSIYGESQTPGKATLFEVLGRGRIAGADSVMMLCLKIEDL